ncbi:MAG: hypothetical protein E3K37_18675 [Candidatus Kuenenia sp.]|nr:hypothetical protein [Candidatus Kuenenia hertensis]
MKRIHNIARCPTIQGAFAEEETPEEAVKELVDVLKMILEYRKERKEEFPEDMIIDANKVITSLPIGIK